MALGWYGLFEQCSLHKPTLSVAAPRLGIFPSSTQKPKIKPAEFIPFLWWENHLFILFLLFLSWYLVLTLTKHELKTGAGKLLFSSKLMTVMWFYFVNIVELIFN